MRTTVDIPDALYRQLKSTAALRGCSVKELIIRGAQSQLNGGAVSNKRRVKFPLIESRTPGRLKLTNRMINEILLP